MGIVESWTPFFVVLGVIFLIALVLSKEEDKTLSATVEITVNIPHKEVAILMGLVDQTGNTTTKIIRQAIINEGFIQEIIDRGGKFWIEESDGTRKLLVFKL